MATTLAALRQQVRARLVETLALTIPGSPLVTPQGTPGTKTITYKIVATNSTGHSEASLGTVCTTAAATLNGTNFNQLTWLPVPGATGYDIYRTTTNGVSPTTTGKIGSWAVSDFYTFNDTGLAGDSATAPVVNTSGITEPFWTEQELFDLLISGARDLWKAIVDLHQGHFVRFVDSTTTPAGTFVYPAGVAAQMTFFTGVPTDCFRILNIEPENLTNLNSAGIVRYFKPKQMHSLDFQAARAMTIQDSANYLTIYYDILNAGSPVGAPQIVGAPPVSSAIPLRLMYVYTLPTLIESDSNPIPGESDNALIAWTVAYAKAKEQDTTNRMPDPGWLAIYNTEKQGLLVALTPRQEQEVEVVEGMFEMEMGGW